MWGMSWVEHPEMLWYLLGLGGLLHTSMAKRSYKAVKCSPLEKIWKHSHSNNIWVVLHHKEYDLTTIYGRASWG